MFSVGFLVGSGLASLILGTVLHHSMKERDAAIMEEEITPKKEPIEFKATDEAVVPVVMVKPKTTTPELRAIWHFFEAFERGNVKVVPNCDKIGFEHIEVMFNIYDIDEKYKIVFITYKSTQFFKILYDIRTKEFREFKDGMNLLDEEDLSIFTSYLQMILHSSAVSGRQVEKSALANQVVNTPKKATPRTNASVFSWEAYLNPLKKDPLHQTLAQTTVLLMEAIHEKDYLEAEDAHRLERVETRILPDLVQSYVQLSADERTLQREAMKVSLAKIQKILNDLKQQARKQYVTAFEKNVERINQLEV